MVVNELEDKILLSFLCYQVVMMRLCILFTALFLSVEAQAAGFEFLGPQGDWDVFADKKSNATVCYIASVPQSASHKDKRGDIYVLVTRRKSEGFKDVVSFHQGYPLKKGKDIQLAIGGADYKLFASDETAWAYNSKDDLSIVKMMKAGSTMEVNATSSRGTDTKDVYSLKGISAAHAAMVKACS